MFSKRISNKEKTLANISSLYAALGHSLEKLSIDDLISLKEDFIQHLAQHENLIVTAFVAKLKKQYAYINPSSRSLIHTKNTLKDQITKMQSLYFLALSCGLYAETDNEVLLNNYARQVYSEQTCDVFIQQNGMNIKIHMLRKSLLQLKIIDSGDNFISSVQSRLGMLLGSFILSDRMRVFLDNLSQTILTNQPSVFWEVLIAELDFLYKHIGAMITNTTEVIKNISCGLILSSLFENAIRSHQRQELFLWFSSMGAVKSFLESPNLYAIHQPGFLSSNQLAVPENNVYSPEALRSTASRYELLLRPIMRVFVDLGQENYQPTARIKKTIQLFNSANWSHDSYFLFLNTVVENEKLQLGLKFSKQYMHRLSVEDKKSLYGFYQYIAQVQEQLQELLSLAKLHQPIDIVSLQLCCQNISSWKGRISISANIIFISRYERILAALNTIIKKPILAHIQQALYAIDELKISDFKLLYNLSQIKFIDKTLIEALQKYTEYYFHTPKTFYAFVYQFVLVSNKIINEKEGLSLTIFQAYLDQVPLGAVLPDLFDGVMDYILGDIFDASQQHMQAISKKYFDGYTVPVLQALQQAAAIMKQWLVVDRKYQRKNSCELARVTLNGVSQLRKDSQLPLIISKAMFLYWLQIECSDPCWQQKGYTNLTIFRYLNQTCYGAATWTPSRVKKIGKCLSNQLPTEYPYIEILSGQAANDSFPSSKNYGHIGMIDTFFQRITRLTQPFKLIEANSLWSSRSNETVSFYREIQRAQTSVAAGPAVGLN